MRPEWRRISLGAGSLLVLGIIAFSASWWINRSLASQRDEAQVAIPDEAPQPPMNPLVRRADFSIENATNFVEAANNPSLLWEVHGKGGVLPIRSKVLDTGAARRVKRLKVAFAVYQKARPGSSVPGEFVDIFLADGEMRTDPAATNTEACNIDIPLPPGEYVFYFIVCDPDVELDESSALAEFLGPAAAKVLPGAIVNARLCLATVLPGE